MSTRTIVCSVRANAKAGKVYHHAVWGRVRIRKLGKVQRGTRINDEGATLSESSADYRLARVTRVI